MNKNIDNKARIDFECLNEECNGIIKFKLAELVDPDFSALCPICRQSYEFNDKLKDKLNRLRRLIAAIRDAEGILGDCNVGVAVSEKEIKIPYALLLTRLNTMISLELGGRNVDFNLRVEPGSEETFR